MRKKSKVAKRGIIPQVEPESIELCQDDFNMFDEFGDHLGFLTKMNPTGLTQVSSNIPIDRKRVALVHEDEEGQDEEDVTHLSNSESGDGRSLYDTSNINTSNSQTSNRNTSIHEDEEQAFEMAPRKINKDWIPKQSNRLPVFNEQGKLCNLPARNLSGTPQSDSESDNKSDSNESVYESKPGTRGTRALVDADKKLDFSREKDTRGNPNQLKTHEIPEFLAITASLIMENPELNFAKLAQLRLFIGHKNPQVVKLAILTLAAVFKDIIPGYRIRSLTEAEMKTQVSKDVKRVREFEQSLVANYKNYLKELDTIAKCTETLELKIQAVCCFCELLTSATHFNFRTNILSVVVGFMCSSVAAIADRCCDAVSLVFKSDECGDVSLEGIKAISAMIKKNKYKINERIVKTFVYLRLRNELDSATASSQSGRGSSRSKSYSRDSNDAANKTKKSKEKSHVSRQLRKKIKVDSELEKELKEAEAVYDKQEKKRLHTETLKHLFVVYFRILKESKNRDLLFAVLEGLAKFAHLISVDFFKDLMTILRQLAQQMHQSYLEGTPQADPKSELHCVIAAYKLCSGPGQALNVDLKDFSRIFYQILPRLLSSMSNSTCGGELELKSTFEYVLFGLELAFLHQKQKYPRLESLLDYEGKSEVGSYRPLSDDPDTCHPTACNSWDLVLLMNHYNPHVCELARNISVIRLSQASNQDQRTNPIFNKPTTELYSRYDFLGGKNGIRFEPKIIKTCKGQKGLDGYSAFIPSQFE